jgi:Terminase small subunit
MAFLLNARHESFAENIARGVSATRAYIAARYSKTGARQNAARLTKNVEIRARVAELRNEITAGFVKLEITNRDARVRLLQDLVHRGHLLIQARGKDMADVPGGETGLLVRSFKGKHADIPVYKVDTGLLREIRKILQQVAEEMGQRVTKTKSPTPDPVELMARLDAGRKRARDMHEAYERERQQKQQVVTVVPDVATPVLNELRVMPEQVKKLSQGGEDREESETVKVVSRHPWAPRW